ncbi:hypothetical protein OAW67_00860 [Planktomarina sp.]|nr:hypothetical protein [Planktomarina sp.]
MSHLQQRIFVDSALKLSRDKFNLNIQTILELGSYDVNGSVRDFFIDSNEYIGVDLTDGPGVDVVYNGIDLNLNKTFDLIISCEMLEHDQNWVNSLKNMISHAHSNSVVIFTCASKGRVEHGTDRSNALLSPGSQLIGWNYYKNLKIKDIKQNFNLDEFFSSYSLSYEKNSNDLYFVGFMGAKNKFDAVAFEKGVKREIKDELNVLKMKSQNPKLNLIYKLLLSVDLPIRWALLTLSEDKLYHTYMLKRNKKTRNFETFVRSILKR